MNKNTLYIHKGDTYFSEDGVLTFTDWYDGIYHVDNARYDISEEGDIIEPPTITQEKKTEDDILNDSVINEGEKYDKVAWVVDAEAFYTGGGIWCALADVEDYNGKHVQVGVSSDHMDCFCLYEYDEEDPYSMEYLIDDTGSLYNLHNYNENIQKAYKMAVDSLTEEILRVNKSNKESL